MTAELQITLNAPTMTLDPSTALADVQSLLGMLGEMETALARRDEVEKTVWRFAKLKLGSLDLAVRPDETSTELPQQASLRLVRGFAEAEQTAAIPEPWTLRAVSKAARVAANLGEDEQTGLTLRCFVDGEEVASTVVTARTARHLRAATHATRRSIGSVIGELGSLSAREGSRAAGIWPERGGRRVKVTFPADQLDQVKRAVAEPRVLIAGRLHRNSRGQLLRIQMRSLAILPSVTDPASVSLRGLDPDMTDGLSAVAYVRRLRAGT